MNNKKIKNLKTTLLVISTAIGIASGSMKTGEAYENNQKQEEIQMYDDIIKDLKELLEKNDVTNPDEIFANFDYMLWNGFLSNKKEFKYNENNNKLTIYGYPTTCMSGEGVCKEMACLLKDLYDEFDYDTFTLSCYLYNESGDNEKETVYGNHLITGVIDGDKIYYYDPTNKSNIIKLGNNFSLIEQEEWKIKAKYPFSLIALNFDNNIINIIKSMANTSNFEYVHKINCDLINESEMYQFYNDHKDSYSQINDKLSDCNDTAKVIEISGGIYFVLTTLAFYIILNKKKKEKEIEKEKEKLLIKQ